MMELISTHICKGKNVGVHGNLFGGTMLSWLDEAGGAYASQAVDSPRIVTVKLSEVAFKKPIRPGHIIKIYGRVMTIGTCSITICLEARRHSPYNGTQRVVCTTEVTYVRIDGDGEAIPISDKVRMKYGALKPIDLVVGERVADFEEEIELYRSYGGE